MRLRICNAPIAAPPAAAAFIVVGRGVVRRVALRYILRAGLCAGAEERSSERIWKQQFIRRNRANMLTADLYTLHVCSIPVHAPTSRA